MFCAVRRVLLIFFWVLAVAGLYAALVVLEVYWNLFDWQPRLDLAAFGIMVWMGMMLAALWCLCRASTDRVIGGVALLLCAALVALAIYVFAPEPVKPGLLGRDTASPLWYRTGRLVILTLPAVFWLLCRRWRKPFVPKPPLEQ